MINWFPGHMNKSIKQMQSDSKLCDCFLYVLDARCPNSCINPEFVKVCKDKPIIYVLSKADLINSKDVERLKKEFALRGAGCVALNSTISGTSKSLIAEIKRVFADRLNKNKVQGVNFVTRAMVLGVPNSGKSTIVNNLCNKGRAVTGNKAGVTKNKQWVRVEPTIEVMDTPGILLPNFENEDNAYNLAFVGSVKTEVLNVIEVASRLIGKLLEIDRQCLTTKYGVDINNITHNVEILERIARKRGCLVKGGEVDLERAALILLADFRSAKLGKICLE